MDKLLGCSYNEKGAKLHTCVSSILSDQCQQISCYLFQDKINMHRIMHNGIRCKEASNHAEENESIWIVCQRTLIAINKFILNQNMNKHIP